MSNLPNTNTIDFDSPEEVRRYAATLALEVDRLQELLDQPIVSGLVPDGWQLVPIKITEPMRISAWNEPEHGHSDLVERIWAGALAASPSAKDAS